MYDYTANVRFVFLCVFYFWDWPNRTNHLYSFFSHANTFNEFLLEFFIYIVAIFYAMFGFFVFILLIRTTTRKDVVVTKIALFPRKAVLVHSRFSFYSLHQLKSERDLCVCVRVSVYMNYFVYIYVCENLTHNLKFQSIFDFYSIDLHQLSNFERDLKATKKQANKTRIYSGSNHIKSNQKRTTF